MLDKTDWLSRYVNQNKLPKAIEEFNNAFSITANHFENDGWFVDDCINFIYDYIAEYVDEFTDETIKNVIDVIFVENVVDAIGATSYVDNNDFSGDSYQDEYLEDVEL